jgi:HEPN domain-containing protein
MIALADMDHMPWMLCQELRSVTGMIFEVFSEMAKGRLSDQYRTGRILSVILYGAHVGRAGEGGNPEEAFHLLLIVNHPRLARNGRDWHAVHDRLRRAWEFGEIGRPVRLAIESLGHINDALIAGVPHFVTIATQGVALYREQGFRLESSRNLPLAERRARGLVEHRRWFGRAGDFLIGAAFYQDRGNMPMAALLLHQACEHLYQCVLWSLTLHGPRTHALDELREAAEAVAPELGSAWPRDTSFERRAFGCIRRAYVEVRYGPSYRVTEEELDWAMGCAASLHRQVDALRCERLDEDMPQAEREACHG